MFESMYAAHGVGLAAPQIGIGRRIAVVDVTFKEDPEARSSSSIRKSFIPKARHTQSEGCLSIPDFRENVTRPNKVTVRAQDAHGKVFRENRRRTSCPRIPSRNRSPQRQALHQPYQRAQTRLDEAQNPKADESRRVVEISESQNLVIVTLRGFERPDSRQLPNYKMSLDLIFCGTPSFAVPTLEKLVSCGFRVRLVVTQPDRPKGRGLELVASPVKQSALASETSCHSAGAHQDQRGISRSTHIPQTRCDHRGRLRPDHSAMDARSSSAWQHQSSCFAAPKIPGRRSHSMGDRER